MKQEEEKSKNLINEEKEENGEEQLEENQILEENNIKSSEEDDKDFISSKKKFVPFTNDPYLDSNIISRFFVYWGYRVLKISKSTKIKKMIRDISMIDLIQFG